VKKKIAFITWLPTPYRTPLLKRIANWDEIELKVFYCGRSAPDRNWEFNPKDNETFSEILPGIALNIPYVEKDMKINTSIISRLSKGNFNAIIVNGYVPLTMLFAIGWALINNIPYIINSESQLLNSRSRWKSIIKRIFLTPIVKRASAYLPTGKYAGEYLIHYGAKPEKIFYFPNTPDIDFFIKESDKYREEKNKIKKRLGIKNDYVVLFVGRLIKVKGLFTLLKGFKKVKEKFSNVSLLIAGDGVLRKSLEGFTKREKLEDVYFTGFVSPERLPRYYAISDIFVLPSNYEPWGVVVNEAMASGLPVVLSDKVGSRDDLLKEGVNGFCFKSGEHEELANILKEMLSNPKKLKQMGEKSREIIKGYDYSYCEENLKKALKSLGIVNWLISKKEE